MESDEIELIPLEPTKGRKKNKVSYFGRFKNLGKFKREEIDRFS